MFGSYAKGCETADSDLDLLIIKQTDVPFFKRSKEIRMKLRPWSMSMDILIYTPDEVKERENSINDIVNIALSEGKVVYERNFMQL